MTKRPRPKTKQGQQHRRGCRCPSCRLYRNQTRAVRILDDLARAAEQQPPPTVTSPMPLGQRSTKP